VAVNIYRVAQEALTNVGKHAGARQVNICLAWEEGKLKMSILDDGRGFDIAEAVHGSKAQGHFGLAGMQERVDLIGGQWSLKSVPGEGTTVQVTWRA
jgi:signal transduction histidine kinase